MRPKPLIFVFFSERMVRHTPLHLPTSFSVEGCFQDPREPDYLKTILHRIYLKFMLYRPFTSTPIINILSYLKHREWRAAWSSALAMTRPRTRKRVFAIRRASDGSAFQKCEGCGVSVAIALADMHECEPMKGVKRFRGISVSQNVATQSLGDQPISSFRLFMEGFVKTCVIGDMIEIDRRGFETWKNMSKEERQPFVSQAEKVNSAYEKALNKEVNDMIQVDDEADSAMVGKFDKFHQFCEESSEYYSESSFEEDWFLVDGTRESWTFEEESK